MFTWSQSAENVQMPSATFNAPSSLARKIRAEKPSVYTVTKMLFHFEKHDANILDVFERSVNRNGY